MNRKQDLTNLPELMKRLYEKEKYYVSISPGENENYEDRYWSIIEDPDGEIRDRLKERDVFLNNIKYLTDFLNGLNGGKILDVGCGLGWLLSALENSWEKYGIEISKFAMKFANKFGNIFNGSLLKYECVDNFFDVIVMHHVIEHMKNPILNLKKIKKILKSNGVLIIATPDFDSGCARRFGINYRLLNDKTHISLFSNDSMHRFLRDHNFNIFRVEYPYFNTRYFTENNLLRLFDISKVSPPFYGNYMTFFSINKKEI